MHIGIDYGARMAGTTALAWVEDGKINFLQSQKKEDADIFLLREIRLISPQRVFIDAPLSLPAVYRYDEGFEDYFYRRCDRELNAMSPMFLGGLTARAMKLAHILSTKNMEVRETYPRAMAHQLDLTNFYKNDIKRSITLLKLPYPLKYKPDNWHQFDALLAWYSGWKYEKGKATSKGNEKEGYIWI